ncbi:MAG: serine hydrolase, partial [Actinobacteria bacterium]|nr:serine hydrolase [Actinomycetota bacterium]
MDQHAQEATTHALNQAIATLGETGLQAAAIHQGTMVVNAVAGIADVSTGALVTPDTLF